MQIALANLPNLGMDNGRDGGCMVFDDGFRVSK